MKEFLLHQETDVNDPPPGNLVSTPLITAASAGRLAPLQLLLDHGADPNITGSLP
jgi:ankyrin repeat protein